jgi:hypothetical protein
MSIIYISGDVETTGPTPGTDFYSMIAFGMVVVDDPSMTFYRELKPLNRQYVPEALRVGAKGLECLAQYKGIPEYDPTHVAFEPERVLDVLESKGSDPAKAMREAYEWVEFVKQNGKVRYCARPVMFDGAFMNHYFIKFCMENPLGHSGEDINSLYRGSKGDENASISEFHQGEIPHNALQDAIIQAADFRRVREEMEKNAAVRKMFK